MALNFEEISNGIAENPELKTQLLTHLEPDAMDFLRAKGIAVRTAEEDDREFGKKLSPKLSEIYGNLEKDALDTFGDFGLKKDSPTEKVYDLIKKAGILTKAKIADYETQIAALKDGKHDQVSEAKIKALELQVQAAQTEKEQLIEGYTKKELSFKAGQDVDKAFASLKISVPASVPEKDKAAFIENKQAQLSALLRGKYQVKEENGQIIYTDAEGNVQMKGSNVATAKDLLSDNFKYDFEAVTKTGSGSQGSDNGGVPTIVQNKQQLYEQLSKEGLTQGSKDWLARAKALATENNIDLGL